MGVKKHSRIKGWFATIQQDGYYCSYGRLRQRTHRPAVLMSITPDIVDHFLASAENWSALGKMCACVYLNAPDFHCLHWHSKAIFYYNHIAYNLLNKLNSFITKNTGVTWQLKTWKFIKHKGFTNLSESPWNTWIENQNIDMGKNAVLALTTFHWKIASQSYIVSFYFRYFSTLSFFFNSQAHMITHYVSPLNIYLKC